MLLRLNSSDVLLLLSIFKVLIESAFKLRVAFFAASENGSKLLILLAFI